MVQIIKWCKYIQDYERLAYDYSRILCHTTQNKMSKINYDVDIIYPIIDETQQEFYYSIIKDELLEIIKNNGTINDIKKYVEGL